MNLIWENEVLVSESVQCCGLYGPMVIQVELDQICYLSTCMIVLKQGIQRTEAFPDIKHLIYIRKSTILGSHVVSGTCRDR